MKLLMKKIFIPIAILIVIASVATVIVITNRHAEVDVDYLSAMELNPPDNYVEELTSIVENNDDPYIRERAIFTLTKIAIRGNETDEIIDFLKNLAINDKDEDIQSAAYSNIYLIREIYPSEKQGSVELSIIGEIRKGGNITLCAKVSSKFDVNIPAIVGIGHLDNNIELNSPGVEKIWLKANEPQEVRFNLHLKETGQYIIPVGFELRFDLVDYESIHQRVLIKIDETSGEYSLLEG